MLNKKKTKEKTQEKKSLTNNFNNFLLQDVIWTIFLSYCCVCLFLHHLPNFFEQIKQTKNTRTIAFKAFVFFHFKHIS